MRIAFFDSGIGGITVLKEALQVLPHAEYIYYADTKNVPYGTKTTEQVYALVLAAVDFLSQFKPDALVIACNTATSIAIDGLRKTYPFPIIGMEPAIKPAIVNNNGKKILITATPLTLKETKLEILINSLDKEQKTEKKDLYKLVCYAEDFNFQSDEVVEYISNEFKDVTPDKFESIVLGCTHFIYYKEIIQRMFNNKISIIDGNRGTVNNLLKVIASLEDKEKEDRASIRFYSSGIEDRPERSEQLRKLIEISG